MRNKRVTGILAGLLSVTVLCSSIFSGLIMTSSAVQIVDPCSSNLPPAGDIRREFNPSRHSFEYASCKINQKFDQLGWGGQPLSDVTRTRDDLGYYRDYQDPAGNPYTIFYSEKTDAHEIHGAIREKYKELEAQGLLLGIPATDEKDAAGGGKYNDFLLGDDKSSSIYWLPGTGAHEIYGEIWKKWVALGREYSPLRYPIAAELDARDGGRYQDFQEGAIYSKPGIGAYEVHGAIFDKWDEIRGRHLARESGPLGYPISDETTNADGIGRYNNFEQGAIVSTSQTGAHAVYGEIYNKWGEWGWEQGSLGYPLTDELYTPDRNGRYNQFQHGYIVWRPGTGVYITHDITSSVPPRTYTVHIHAIRTADNDGSRPADINAQQVQQWVNQANEVFSPGSIQFQLDPIPNDPNWLPLRNSAINNLDSFGSGQNEAKQVAAQFPGKLVVFFRHGPGPDPNGNGFSNRGINFIAMPGFLHTYVITGKDASGNWIWSQNFGQLSHDIGHYLGLDHTFPGVDDDVTDEEEKAATYIKNNGGTADALDGDRLYDTPPEAGTDFYIKKRWDPCSNTEGHNRYTISGTNSNGVPFTYTFTPDRHNVMSYFACKPMGFTPMQFSKMREILEERARQDGLSIGGG